uniref:Probable proton-coupled zinc antiporter SLC30A3 n=1 Tax=Takifugu rubripes TaxID=31033 RepID=H2SRN1_TAKRU
MELSEKQQLIENHHQPLGWYILNSVVCVSYFMAAKPAVLFFRTRSPQETCSDSASQLSEGASDVGDLWWSDQLCQQTVSTSGPESDARRRARRKLCIACAMSLVFMTGELIGGYAAHSLAIMTDAAHLLTDFGSIAISLFSLWLSSRPPTDAMTFGWQRAEILGMLLSVVSIWAVTAALVLSAIQRLVHGDYDVDGHIMLITSGCAVGVNILMVLVLHQSGVSHGHSHAPHQHQRPGRCDHENASVRAAFVHVLGDLVQSVGVLLAAAIIQFWPEYKAADPICTFLFSALVLGTTVPVTKDVFRILMEGTPRDVRVHSVRTQLLSVSGVTDVHSLHVWSLNMTHALLSVHVTAEEEADAQTVLTNVTNLLRSEFSFSGVTVQVER